MRKTLFNTIGLLGGVVMLLSLVSSKDESFKVDTKLSKIAWVGKNVAGGTHTGHISLESGLVIMDGTQLKGGQFIIDMNTITVTDLTGSRKERLENHLRSEDFFEIEKHPKTTFKITEVRRNGQQLAITGDLTMKNITKSITFPASVTRSGDRLTAQAKDVTIDRTQFDVKYRSGNFFSGLGDRAISDQITMDIELVAKK